MKGIAKYVMKNMSWKPIIWKPIIWKPIVLKEKIVTLFSETSPVLFVCFVVVLYLFVVVQKQLLCFYMLCANLIHTDLCLAQHEHKTNRPPYIQSSPTLLLNSQNSSEQTKTGWGPKRIGGTKGCFLHFWRMILYFQRLKLTRNKNWRDFEILFIPQICTCWD